MCRTFNVAESFWGGSVRPGRPRGWNEDVSSCRPKGWYFWMRISKEEVPNEGSEPSPSSQDLFVNGISCHNLLFYSVLLRHSGVHCHLSNLPYTVNGSRVPSRRSQKFASILTISRHWFYPGQTQHTADRAHPTQKSARAFNLLKFALNLEEEEDPKWAPNSQLPSMMKV